LFFHGFFMFLTLGAPDRQWRVPFLLQSTWRLFFAGCVVRRVFSCVVFFSLTFFAFLKVCFSAMPSPGCHIPPPPTPRCRAPSPPTTHQSERTRTFHARTNLRPFFCVCLCLRDSGGIFLVCPPLPPARSLFLARSWTRSV